MGIEGFTIRPFNNFGPRQAFKPELAGVIPNTIVRIIQGKPPIIRGDGMQLREYVYVQDCIDESIQAISNCRDGEIKTIGSGIQITVNEIVESICQMMEYNGPIIHEVSRTADALVHRSEVKVDISVANENKARHKSQMLDTIRYYRELLSGM